MSNPLLESWKKGSSSPKRIKYLEKLIFNPSTPQTDAMILGHTSLQIMQNLLDANEVKEIEKGKYIFIYES